MPPTTPQRGRAVLALVCACAAVLAAGPVRAADESEVRPPEGVGLRAPEKAHWLLPTATVVAENVGLWAVDRYVLDVDYARIGLDSISTNLSEGFTWDDNDFVINQFGHPYQGGVYHITARSAGRNFWSSIPYVALGSLQWELFMETERPALNDLVTTTLGGAVVGEILYRSARLVRDDSAVGLERVFRETLGTVLDPVTGVPRLLSGEAFRVGAATPAPPYRVALSLGVDRIGRPEDLDSQVRLVHGELDLVYGELPSRGERLAPFDRFSLAVGANGGRSFSASRLDFDGILGGLPVHCGEESRCMLAAVAHFDFSHSPLFKVGTTALGGGLFLELPLGGSWRLDFDLELMAVVLGGFDSPYAEQFGPQYNLGHGGLWRSRIALYLGRWGLVLESDRYVVRTLYGALGRELAGVSRSALVVPLPWDHLSLELGTGLFDRTSQLDDFEDLHRLVVVGQTHLVWSW